MISSAKCNWRPLISGVAQGSLLSQVLLKIFNHLGNGEVCICSKTSECTKLGGVTFRPEGHAGTQRDQFSINLKVECHFISVCSARKSFPLLPYLKNPRFLTLHQIRLAEYRQNGNHQLNRSVLTRLFFLINLRVSLMITKVSSQF